LVQPRVRGDEPLESRNVAGVDAQNAIQQIDRGSAFSAAERLIDEKGDHLERFVEIVLFQIKLRERFACCRLVRISLHRILESALRGVDVSLWDEMVV